MENKTPKSDRPRYFMVRCTPKTHKALNLHAKNIGLSVQGMFEPIARVIGGEKPVTELVKVVANALGKPESEVLAELKKAG